MGFYQYGRYWESTEDAHNSDYWKHEAAKDLRRKGIKCIWFGVDNRTPEMWAEIQEDIAREEREKEEDRKYMEDHIGEYVWAFIKGIVIVCTFPCLCWLYLGVRYGHMNYQQKNAYKLAWVFSLLALISGPVGFMMVFTLFGLYIIFDAGHGMMP